VETSFNLFMIDINKESPSAPMNGAKMRDFVME